MLFGRFDGKRVRDLPAYRQMVPFLMRGRNESAVYFEQVIDLGATLPWLEATGARLTGRGLARPTLFHLVLLALARVLDERPRLNRFVSGRRIYQRHGIFVSFAAKQRFDDDAPLSVVKKRIDPAGSFAGLVGALTGQVDDARTGKKSAIEREVDLLVRLPGPILAAAVRLLRFLDRYNLAPRALIGNDPMYTSVFVANLGSIQIDAAYHHLYEHGNCPLFVTIGKIDPAAARVRLKYTYDERIEDGLYCARALQRFQELLEKPASWVTIDGPGDDLPSGSGASPPTRARESSLGAGSK